MTKRCVTHGTFTIERVYQAQPPRVFAALSDPAEKTRWFHGPEEWGPDDYSMDFREGGLEVSRGGPQGGPIISYEARFEDIVPDQRIVSTYVMHHDDKRISVSLAIVDLQPEGSGTRLTFTESGAYLDDFDKPEVREHGTAELLDTLGTYLSGESAGRAPATAPEGRWQV
jgi:uncharacterized protein YndB with AHSA1/START domain